MITPMKSYQMTSVQYMAQKYTNLEEYQLYVEMRCEMSMFKKRFDFYCLLPLRRFDVYIQKKGTIRFLAWIL